MEFYQQELSRERGARYGLDNIIGESASVLRLKEQIVQAARSTSTVLIEGETGSGKELIAHSIHAMSARKAANFVRVNCSAIPAELMESEFFGYAAGAFTGAARKGPHRPLSARQRAAPFFSTRSTCSPPPCSPSFSGYFRRWRSTRWAGRRAFPSTCG